VEVTQAWASSEACGDVVPAIVVGSTRLTACLGNCVLPASASGLPIRLDVVEGKRVELAGRLQQRYGYAKDQAEKEIDSWLKSIH
jgi:hypothetical protein